MKIITLTPQEVESRVKELILQIDFKPQMIVGVLNGAHFLIEIFKKDSKFNDAFFQEVYLQRTSNKFKGTKLVSCFLKVLPYCVLDRLRIWESKKVKSHIHNINFSDTNDEKLINHLPQNKFNDILIIDDALDTGKTALTLKKQLANQYKSAKIKIAVLSWTINESIVHPDYYIYKNVLVRYPWSKDFKE